MQVYPPPLGGPGNEYSPTTADSTIQGWFAVLYLRQGQLEQCHIYNTDRVLLLSGQQAYDFLDQRGHLYYDELVEQSLPPNLAAPSRTRYRLVSDQDVLRFRAGLSREVWRVLSLIDGNRSDDELIKMSGYSPNTVKEILDWLQRQGWIK